MINDDDNAYDENRNTDVSSEASVKCKTSGRQSTRQEKT